MLLCAVGDRSNPGACTSTYLGQSVRDQLTPGTQPGFGQGAGYPIRSPTLNLWAKYSFWRAAGAGVWGPEDVAYLPKEINVALGAAGPSRFPTSEVFVFVWMTGPNAV